MSLLNQFEQQYSSITAEITSKIGRLSVIASSGEQKETVDSVERLLIEVEDVLDQMELTVRELPLGSTERGKYEVRVKSYRSDKEQLSKELGLATRRLREAAGRDELLGSPGASEAVVFGEDHKAQLLRNSEALERSSRKIDESYRVCLETEQVGASVLENLETQRGTIFRSRDRLREAEEDLGQSSKILSSMIARVIQNRLLLLLFSAFLLFIVGVVIYMTFS